MDPLTPISGRCYPFNEVIPGYESNVRSVCSMGEPSPFIERSKKLSKVVEKEEMKTIEDYDEFRRKPRFSVSDKKPGNYFLIRMQKAHEHHDSQIDHHLWEYEKKEEKSNIVGVNKKTMKFEGEYEYVECDDNILNIELIEPNRNFSSGFAKDLDNNESKYLPSYSPKRLLSPPRSPNSYSPSNSSINNNNNNIITINLQRTTPILHYEPIELSNNLDENPRFISGILKKKKEEEKEVDSDNNSEYSNESSINTGVIKKYNGCLPQLSLTMKKYMEENNVNHFKYESLKLNKIKEKTKSIEIPVIENVNEIYSELNESELINFIIPEYHYEEIDAENSNNKCEISIELPSEIIHNVIPSKSSTTTTTTTITVNRVNDFIPSNTAGGISEKADDSENIEVLSPCYGFPTTTTINNCYSPITMKNNYFINSSRSESESVKENNKKKVKPAPTYIQTVKRMLKAQKKVVSLDAFYRERSRLVINLKLPHCDESFNIRLFEIKDYNGLLQLIYSDKLPQYYYGEYVNMKKSLKYWVIEAYQPNNEYIEIIHNESTFKTAIKQYELMKWSMLYLRVVYKYNESSIIKARLPEPLNLDPDYPRYERPFDPEVQNMYLDGNNLNIPLSPNFKQPIILPPNHIHYPYVNEEMMNENETSTSSSTMNNNNNNRNTKSEQSLMDKYSSSSPPLQNDLPVSDSVEVKISRSLCVTLSDMNSSSQYEESVVNVNPSNFSKSTTISPSKRTIDYSPPPVYTHGFGCNRNRNGVQSSPALIPRTRYAELQEISTVKPKKLRRNKFNKTVGVTAPSKMNDSLPTVSDVADYLTHTSHPYNMYEEPSAHDQVLVRNSPFSQYSAKLPAPCDRKIMESIQDFYFFNHKEKFKYPFKPKKFLPPLTSLLSPAQM